VAGLIFIFQSTENQIFAQKAKPKSKPKSGKIATLPEPSKSEKPSPILPVKELKVVDQPGFFQGIPDSLLYSAKTSFAGAALSGDRYQYPVVLVPVRLQSGFVPDLFALGKELLVLAAGDADPDDVVVFKEQGLPEALLIRSPYLTRQLQKSRALQVDSIRYFCFTSGPHLGSEIFLKKNRNCNTQDFQKRVDIRVEYLNSIIKPELPKQALQSPDAEVQAKP
jgi:hypothetical protein